MNGDHVLLDVRGLTKHYPIQKGFLRRVIGHVKAVDGVSFTVREGETLALVGESGCGKTTVAKAIVRAIEPTAGEAVFRQNGEDVDIAKVSGAALKHLRRDVQMIFQDPYSSLNPRQRVRDIIGEPLYVNGLARGAKLADRVAELMEAVGLRPEHAIRYPHAFSGGQRQRIGIARALALHPRLVVCDEPVSALDMSIQAQILNLLKELQSELGLTYLFISHDLSVVQHVSDRVAVMYLGKIVEIAPARELFGKPAHPYTEALLSASPKPHPRHRGQMKIIAGEVPDAAQELSGCYFQSRCPYAQEVCAVEQPTLRAVRDSSGGGLAACHFVDDLGLRGVESARG
jgi:peptide/nickel transport system ATP-binding protein